MSPLNLRKAARRGRRRGKTRSEMLEHGSELPVLARMDRAILRLEGAVAALLLGALALLMLANVGLRAFGRPLLWGDELAVYLMVWTAFLGASIAIATRMQVAVDLLAERLGARGRDRLALLVDAVVLAALLILSWLVWRWFDPVGLLRTGSGAALAAETFNFIYQNPTLTLGLPKTLFWAVLPVFCLCAAFHALAALCDDIARLSAGRRT